MELILLKKVDNLGALGDKVVVRPGYGRNYLVPHGMAVPATADNLRQFNERRAELEKAAVDALAQATARKERFAALSVVIAQRAGDEGKLYGSVGTADIARAATAAGVDLERHEIRLPNGPLRLVGDYAVDLHLHAEIDAQLKVTIIPEV